MPLSLLLQITHTPMILAEEFSRSQTARISDFTTSKMERGVFWMRERRAGSAEKALDVSSESQDRNADIGEADKSHDSHENAEAGPSNFPQFLPKPLDTPSRYHHHRSQTQRLPTSPFRPSPDHILTSGILIAQFASPNGKALADAVELISVRDKEGRRMVDGVDLNCVSIIGWIDSELRRPCVCSLGLGH